MKAAKCWDLPLNDREIRKLRWLVAMRGEAAAVRHLRISVATLARMLAGLPVWPRKLAQVRQGLWSATEPIPNGLNAEQLNLMDAISDLYRPGDTPKPHELALHLGWEPDRVLTCAFELAELGYLSPKPANG